MIDPSRIEYLLREAHHRIGMGRGDMPLAASADELVAMIEAYQREGVRLQGGPVENVLRDASVAIERKLGLINIIVCVATDGKSIAANVTPFVAGYADAFADNIENAARLVREQGNAVIDEFHDAGSVN